MKDGLSYPVINCVLQDKKGFIWVGTEIGLNKYDSQKFKPFYADPADSLSLPNDFVSCLYEDRAENLWVGTQSGLAVYNRTNRTSGPATFRRFKDATLQTKKILAITGNTTAKIWVLTSHELVLVDYHFVIKKKYSLKNISSEIGLTAFSTAKLDAQGQLWISTNKGVRLFNTQTQKLTNPLSDLIDAHMTTADFFQSSISTVIKIYGWVCVEMAQSIIRSLKKNGI